MAGIAVALLGIAVAGGVGRRVERVDWREALLSVAGLELLLGFYMFVLMASPAAKAAQRNGAKVLEMPRWRRAAFVFGWPGLPGWPLAVWAFARGDITPGIVVSLVTAAFTAVMFYGSTASITFDGQEMRAMRRGVVKRRVRWDEVSAVDAFASGVRVHGNNVQIGVAGLLLDGYPEFIRELLNRVPPERIDANPEARPMLERVAALAR